MLLINLKPVSQRAASMQVRAKNQGLARKFNPDQATYFCTKCKDPKPASQFFISKGKVKAWCKRCHGQAGTIYKRNNTEARKRYAWSSRLSRLLKNFKITIDVYEGMFKDQQGLCKLCCRPETSPGNSSWGNSNPRLLAVDHDHVTGVVRGLLCSNCNRALGLLRDDPKLLRRAVIYVETDGRGLELPSIPQGTAARDNVKSRPG